MPEPRPGLALVLALAESDAVRIETLLGTLGVTARRCADMAELAQHLNNDVLCAVLVHDALAGPELDKIAAWHAAEPVWSDLPFVVLHPQDAPLDWAATVTRLERAMGNVAWIAQPFHSATFLGVAGAAIRGRRRQFGARAHQQELQESEERLQTALKTGYLGSWELDLSTRTLLASPTCKAIFGRPAGEDFTYEQLLVSVHPEDRARMQAAVMQTIQTGCEYVIEYRNVWPDGSEHWVDIRARLVPGDGTRPDRMVGVSSDITARRTAEDALRRLNESLEAKVAARTAELERAHASVLEEIRQREQAEEQLRQVQKLDMIGQLSGGIAHDFNNLLMAIIANLELARKEVATGSRIQQLIDGAFRGAQRGAALTQRLLAFARQQELKVEPVRLSTLIEGMAELFERTIGSAIELRIDIQAVCATTLLDANQVELALLNLVVNARDAMPDGGTLTIRVDTARSSGTQELRAGDYVRVTVADTGLGMDAATLARATEPFFTTKEVGKGTGLGLSMTHGLALQLHGALRLHSVPGQGTAASLWLPLSLHETDPIRAEPAPVAPAPARDAPAIILLVDDDLLISTSTAYLLEDLGHLVLSASSGEAAMRLLQAGQAVDLLITDYSMPRMTGLELVSAARRLRPGLPAILATGYAELPDGATVSIPQLRKPYQQQQLAAEIRKALSPVPPPAFRINPADPVRIPTERP